MKYNGTPPVMGIYFTGSSFFLQSMQPNKKTPKVSVIISTYDKETMGEYAALPDADSRDYGKENNT
jgi:hypothetical protein